MMLFQNILGIEISYKTEQRASGKVNWDLKHKKWTCSQNILDNIHSDINKINTISISLTKNQSFALRIHLQRLWFIFVLPTNLLSFLETLSKNYEWRTYKHLFKPSFVKIASETSPICDWYFSEHWCFEHYLNRAKNLPVFVLRLEAWKGDPWP